MILAAGLTPAWQRILEFDAVQLGEVNRAVNRAECASGKVLNVARACHALGAPVQTLSVVGGGAGEAIREEFTRDGISARWIPTAAATRTCTTVLESSGRVTELVENAAPILAAELARFVLEFTEASRGSDVVVLSGSLPPGAPADCYRELLRGYAGRAVLDARGPELLAALETRPFLVKPNRRELEATFGREIATSSELVAALQELNRRGAVWALATQGPGPVVLTSASEVQTFEPDLIARPRNPIGCGDCLAAGIAVGLSRGWDMPAAVPFGMAAAAENALDLLPARLSAAAVGARCRAAAGSSGGHPDAIADQEICPGSGDFRSRRREVADDP